MTNPRRILITGAGRGLGLEFTRLWLKAGDAVFALARKPEASEGLSGLAKEHAGRLFTHPCEVASDDSVEAARARVAREWDGLDLLVNNAGTYPGRQETLESLSLDDMRKVMEVNALGPIRVTRAFLPLLRKGRGARVVNLTSLMGSIADNASGGSWSYRTSKTALNMITRNMAHQMKGDGIGAFVIHPGWVKTGMGGERAPLEIHDSVAAMVRTIDRLTLDRTGSFVDRMGEPLPW